MITDPTKLEWQYGEVPIVTDVFFDCLILLYNERYIGLISPSGDSGNPLRWGDYGGMPQWGIKQPKGWWAYIRKGSELRPIEVRTWDEHFAHLRETK